MVGMGLCMFNYVFYMPSSLPLLHTAIPTPCLNAFWHIDPYIFYGNLFCLVLHSWYYWFRYMVHVLKCTFPAVIENIVITEGTGPTPIMDSTAFRTTQFLYYHWSAMCNQCSWRHDGHSRSTIVIGVWLHSMCVRVASCFNICFCVSNHDIIIETKYAKKNSLS